MLLASGILLFTPEASAIIRNPSFQIKLALIAVGLLNVLWMERALKRGYPGMTARRVAAGRALARHLARRRGGWTLHRVHLTAMFPQPSS